MKVKKLVKKMMYKENIQFDFYNFDGTCIAQYNLADLKRRYPLDHDIYFIMQEEIKHINILYYMKENSINFLIYLDKK